MALFGSSFRSYSLKLSPPHPTGVWELPESAIEELCLPVAKNNAMFISEPSIINRPSSTNRTDSFVEANREFVQTSHGDGQQLEKNVSPRNKHNLTTSETVNASAEDANIVDIPLNLLLQMGLANPRNSAVDNCVQERCDRVNQEVLGDDPTLDMTGTSPSAPLKDTNDIPHHLLVQMGLDQPHKRPSSIAHKKRRASNFNFDKSTKVSKDDLVQINTRNKMQVRSPIPRFLPYESYTRQISTSELPAENSEIPRHILIDLGLIEPDTLEVDTKTTNLCPKRPKRDLKIIETAEAKKHFSTASKIYAEKIKNNNNEDETYMKGSHDKSYSNNLKNSLGTPSSLSPLLLEGHKSDLIDNVNRVAEVIKVKSGRNDDEDESGSGVEKSTGEVEDDSKLVESQSSLSQLFQSQEISLSNYQELMVWRVSSPSHKETADVLGKNEEFRSNEAGETLPDDGEFKGSVDKYKSVQPFIIRGCEPKMFDTSVERNEDKPWKSEVCEGVLEPTKEVSNRDKHVVHEIPTVVSPYFPNENNYPVQDDKRTTLYTTSVPQESNAVIGRPKCDSSEEMELCKQFFKQNTGLRVNSGNMKFQSSNGNKKELGKITKYFPVVKSSKSTKQRTGAKYEKEKPVRTTLPSVQSKLINTFQDSGNVSMKRKIGKLNYSENEKKCGESSVLKPKSSNVKNTFEDALEDCSQYEIPSKHVFKDLPPGTYQSMSQLKPAGFNCKISNSPIPFQLPSKAGNEPSVVNFRRRASENSNHCREIAVMEEEKVEETSLKMESSGNLLEIGFTLCYQEKFSVLNRPEQSESKLYRPAGVMTRIEFSTGEILRFYQSVTELVKENSRSLLLSLLNSKCRKVCYEAQAFILFVLELLFENNEKSSHEWLLLDPLVAMWLLNPDHPPHTFNCVLKELKIKAEVCDGSAVDWKDTISRYLDSQSEVMEILDDQLCQCNLRDVFYQMEIPLIPILASMERRNITVNYEQLKDISKLLQEQMDSLRQSAWTVVGKKFQLSSPVQLRAILYDDLKLHEIEGVTIKTTAHSGAKSTDEGMLKRLLGVHPLPALILDYRRAHKIKSTYIDGMLAHVVDKTSISTTWEQCAAATGRITSSRPNLQSIPKHSENLTIGGECFNARQIFLSRREQIFVAVDFEQIELRVFAHLSEDKSLISAFKEQGDLFQNVTRLRLGKRDFHSSERDKTKTLMYALLYGAGARKISELLSLGLEQAIDICNNFYAAFPGLQTFRARTLKECRATKQLRSLTGRRRLFPNIDSPVLQQKRYAERQAVNFVIQGSAADICKAAMLKAEAALRDAGVEASLLLQIHDELVWEVPDSLVLRAREVIKRTLEDRADYWSDKFKLKVNLPVKITTGKNWGRMTVDTDNIQN